MSTTRRGPGWRRLALPLAWIVTMTLASALAPVLPIQDPDAQDLMNVLQSPRAGHWFGTDSLGRDIFARAIYGLRVTLIVSIGSVLIGLVLGGGAGMLAGYFRGATDRALMAFNNTLLAFPAVVLVVAVMAYPGDALLKVTGVLGIVFAGTFARMARVNTRSLARQDFVTAARAMGMGHARVLVREIAPNLMPALTVFALIMIALAAVAEGTLAFLGLSVQPPTPTLGGMVSSEAASLREAPHAALLPALLLYLTVLSLHSLGERLQRRADGRASVL
jgi:peptide/nickel transport system permease protein